jgi:hypothetical protein
VHTANTKKLQLILIILTNSAYSSLKRKTGHKQDYINTHTHILYYSPLMQVTDKLYHIIFYRVHLVRVEFEITTLGVITTTTATPGLYTVWLCTVHFVNSKKNQRLSRACIVHLVIKKNNWSYVKTMSCSGSHLGITVHECSLDGPVFCSGMKFKMAATAGLSLTLVPMGKIFQTASSLKPNCPGMIIGRPCFFMVQC